MPCPQISTRPNFGYDIVAEFNKDLDSSAGGSVTWDYSLDGWSDIADNKVDLVTVILHELIHGLGTHALTLLPYAHGHAHKHTHTHTRMRTHAPKIA